MTRSFIKILHFIILVIFIILQISLLEHLEIFHISVDIIMITIVGFAIFDDMVFAMVCGLISGIVIDLMFGSILGISALVYALNGFLAGKIAAIETKRKILIYILLIFFVTEINILLLNGVYYIFNFTASIGQLGLELLINPVFNIAVMFLVFPLLRVGKKRKGEIGFTYKDQI